MKSERPPTLHVYYGAAARWHQPTLDRVQDALGRECDHYDGLQADFEYANDDEVRAAVLVVRNLGVPAEGCGVGEGPSKRALDEARDVMDAAYKRHVADQSR